MNGDDDDATRNDVNDIVDITHPGDDEAVQPLGKNDVDLERQAKQVQRQQDKVGKDRERLEQQMRELKDQQQQLKQQQQQQDKVRKDRERLEKQVQELKDQQQQQQQ